MACDPKLNRKKKSEKNKKGSSFALPNLAQASTLLFSSTYHTKQNHTQTQPTELWVDTRRSEEEEEEKVEYIYIYI